MQAIPSFNNTMRAMTEYEIAQIAIQLLKLAIEKNLSLKDEKHNYLACVKLVKEAHGIPPLPEQINISKLKTENLDLRDRIDYLLSAPFLSCADAKQIIIKLQSLEASNEFLRNWIKIVSDPQKLEEKRAEFKEFLESIHMQEEQTQ